ncbi:penicillin acylase family protein [Shewanella mangrovi]|uniref:penicillin acylase family protein n=1 Tax=Shewanella mangrovi TaxID=1515746 RepID=UPI00068BA87F|nr:penicillin acylase family protein [Shewanella mangrovi]
MKIQMKQFMLLLLVCTNLLGCSEEVTEAKAVPQQVTASTEVRWDTYGVAHIYGKTEAATFYGFGWAQAKSQGDILLRLYGQARAKGAEYWGKDYEETDKWLLGNDVPERGRAWYNEQPASFKADLDAFAQGINDFAAKHPETFEPEVLKVLPVSGIDVVTHAHRLMNYIYVASPGRIIGDQAPKVKNGSNTIALAPKKSKSGNAMLLQNPHLPWASGFFTYYEAHLIGPDFEMYGATQVGLPVIRFAFNQQMGISNTVNSMLGATSYLLTLKDGGYLYDGEVKPFETTQKTYKVLQDDGTELEKTLDVRKSIHGAVFTRNDGKTIALRVAGLDRPGMLKQYFDMLQAKNFAEFQSIVKQLQVPTFNITYADKDGNIEYLDNGILPKRKTGDLEFWQGLVPGDSSEYLWTDVHNYEELPKVINPDTGFVQNSNDPPWIATYPPVYKPEDFPPYVAVKGPISFRAQNSVHELIAKDKFSFEEFKQMKTLTHALMADRVLDDLLAAAKEDTDPDVQQAVKLLANWNRSFDEENRAGFLFEEWAAQFAGPRPRFLGKDNYKVSWTLDDPINTPYGIKDPQAAVAMLKVAIAETKKKYGRIDPKFGDISRFKIGDVDLPGRGGYGNLGAFNVITWFDPDGDGIREPLHGETWISMIEFSTPIKAKGMMVYGNSRQKGTKHNADQLEMLRTENYRTLWLQRDEIEAHTESVDMLDLAKEAQ